MNFRGDFARFTATAVVALGMMTKISDVQAFRMIQNTSTGRVTAGALVACDDAGGFAHWTNNSTINWYHNTAGQGSDKASALQAALNSWTNVPNASHLPTYAGTTTAGWATDGLNTLLWAVGNGCTGSCLALTALVLQSGQVIVESDITFNADYSWNTNGTDYDTEGVAAHEIGHSLGIHHTEVSSSPLPTMYAFYFGLDERSLESDDIAALQCAESRYPLGAGTPGMFETVWGNRGYDTSAIAVRNSGGSTIYDIQVWCDNSGNITSSWPSTLAPAATMSVTATHAMASVCAFRFQGTNASNSPYVDWNY